MSVKDIHSMTNRASRYVDRTAYLVCFPMSVIFVLVILLQVLFRYVLQAPIEWYLEVVEISFMWALFMGISIGYKAGSHIQFVILFDRLPPRVQRVLAFVCQGIGLAFFVFMTVYGFQFFLFSRNYFMPTIDISQQWKFLCVPISGVFMAIHTLELIFGNAEDVMEKAETGTDYFRRR